MGATRSDATELRYANYLDVPQDQAWGTLDVSVLLPDELVVIDFKYGRGVAVEAGEDSGEEYPGPRHPKPNPQLAAYGLGALLVLARDAKEPIA